MAVDTGNATVEPWRLRPSGPGSCCRSTRGGWTPLASRAHKPRVPSQARTPLQGQSRVWANNLPQHWKSEKYRNNLQFRNNWKKVHPSVPWTVVLFLYSLDGPLSPKSSPPDTEQAAKAPPGSSLKRLRSSCMVVRMDDVDIRQARFNHPNLIWFYSF